MAKSTCLHIQDRASGPIRVMEIPWISLRIGRAAYCEVRLAEHELADVACRLKRQGRSWQLVPVATPSAVSFEGQTLDHACPLPYDVPFHVGGYCLTLRQDETADPDRSVYGSPYLRHLEAAGTAAGRAEAMNIHTAAYETAPADPFGVDPTREPAPTRTKKNPHASAAISPRPADILNHRWEARWREAGAEIKSRGERYKPPGEPAREGYGASFEPVPLKDARAPAPGSFLPPRTIRSEVSAGADVGQGEQAEARVTLHNDVKPAAAVPGSPLDPGAAPAEPDAAGGPLVLPSCEAAGPQATLPTSAPLSFWDNWAPTYEVIDSKSLTAQGARSAPEQSSHRVDDAPPRRVETDLRDAFSSTLSQTQPTDHREAQPAPTTIGAVAPPLPRPHQAQSGLLFAAPVQEKHRPASRGEEPGTQAEGSHISTGPVPASEDDRPSRREQRARSAAGSGGSSRPLPEHQSRSVEAQRQERAGRHAIRPTAPPSEAHRVARAPELELARGTAGANAGKNAEAREWPSARDILAMHQASQRASAQPAARQEARAYAVPTVAREPSRWVLPAWLAGPPIALLVLACGSASCMLTLAWAGDSYSAAIMTERLLSGKSDGRSRPLPAGVGPPAGTWTKTTAQHLAHWALYLSGSGDAAADMAPVEVRGLLERALQVSPINPTARLALAQLDCRQKTGGVVFSQLGQSRDAVSLASCAAWLLAAGKKDPALRMYRKALEVASHRELSRCGVPRFSDDPAVPRFLLPGEEAVCEVLRALVAQNECPFAEWSQVLPKDTTVPLTAARLLREQGKREAEELIDVYLRGDEPRAPRPGARAVLAAARAEGHALLSHWKEAEQEYRRAIELIDDDTIRRSWWFNLADIALRLDDEAERQNALRAALAVATSDDITRRASDKQRSANPKARPRSAGTKAY